VNFLPRKPRRRSILETLRQSTKVREVEIDDGNYLVDLMPGWASLSTNAHSFDESSARGAMNHLRDRVVACHCAACKAAFRNPA
jgi:hypothetical protein